MFTVVNALGAIVDRSGRVVRCNRNNADEVCPLISEKLKAFPPISTSTNSSGGPTGNTTITLVVTNQKLPFWALQRLAVQVHSSMSRAIQPFATAEDGDILYAVSTDEVDNPSLTPVDLGVIASELAWDAVLSSVPTIPATPAALNVKPRADELRKFIGTYVFPGGGELSIVDAAGSLKAKFKGNGRIYFDSEKDYAITAKGNGLFVLESAARDVLKFEESGGQITGLTMNPGPWAIRAVLRR